MRTPFTGAAFRSGGAARRPGRTDHGGQTGAMATCTHLDTLNAVTPSDDGCHECLAAGGRWVHLRMCQECGHVGCCDSSPSRHATAHFHGTAHPIVRSFEPGEDWFYCYADDLAFEIDGARARPVALLSRPSSSGWHRRLVTEPGGGRGAGPAGVRPALPAAAVRLVAHAGGRRRRA